MAIQLPAWMWPQTQQAQTTWSVRLGRVIHWICTGYAVMCGLVMLVVTIRVLAGDDGAEFDFEFWALPFLAAGSFMFGRGIRFILAGE